VVAVIAGPARLRYGAKVDSNTQIFTQLAREITALKDAQTENIKLMFLPLAPLSFFCLRCAKDQLTPLAPFAVTKGHPSHYFLFLSSTPHNITITNQLINLNFISSNYIQQHHQITITSH